MKITGMIAFCMIILAVILAAGCNGKPTTSVIEFTFFGLESLDRGHFEGWAVFGNETVSLGTFSVGDPLTFTVTGRNLSAADQIMITIEFDNETDPSPSVVVLMAGEVFGSTANMSFPVDLGTSSGSYILATPTNGPNTVEESGIWFLMLPEPPTPGLLLPGLPVGWKYEGWVVSQGTALTSGRFIVNNLEDEFDGYSGSLAGPPFPGEDYLVNPPAGVTFPLNLSDGASKAVISVEPDIIGIDPTGDAPFQIMPLVADIPMGAADHVNYPMNQNLTSIPTGVAVITVT